MTSFIDEYHKLYEKSKIWEKNSWFGMPCWKLPMDMMVIQELIVKLRPNFIIETGTGCGGSAMFYASICELLGEGEVITCDIEMKVEDRGHYEFEDRITLLHGSSTNDLIVKQIYGITGKAGDHSCMVILDSYHTEEHVYKEMVLYSPLVPVGGYMIVEDSHASKDGNPIKWKWDDNGPSAAIDRFLKMYDGWEPDYECEKHLLTFNPKGYLRRTE